MIMTDDTSNPAPAGPEPEVPANTEPEEVKPKRKYRKIPKVLIDENTGIPVTLNPSQRTLLKYLPKQGIRNAAMTAKMSNGLAQTTLKLPAVQQYMRKTLWQAGVTDELIAERIREGLDATMTKEFLTKDGDIIEGQERIDHEQRGRYIDRAMRLQGIDKQITIDPGAPVHTNINLVALSADDLKLLIETLKSKDQKNVASKTANGEPVDSSPIEVDAEANDEPA